MKNNTKKALLAVAIVFLSIGLLAFAYLAVDFFTSAETDTSETTASLQHEPIEYKYDTFNRLTSEVYYENDVYMGQTDYHYDGNDTHKMVFDKDRNLIENSVLTVNAMDNPVKQENYINGELKSSYECTYYPDLSTPHIETRIEYKDGDELAFKSYYEESGELYLECEYKNGELVSETNYDGDKIISESEEVTENEG